jgi:hypothetical protein
VGKRPDDSTKSVRYHPSSFLAGVSLLSHAKIEYNITICILNIISTISLKGLKFCMLFAEIFQTQRKYVWTTVRTLLNIRF